MQLTRTKRFRKQPGEKLDYDFDFSNWLPTGVTIASSVVTADSGITLETKVETNAIVKQWISGGINGESYTVTCLMTSSTGHKKESELILDVREKPTSGQ
jgi:hypothetical protein